MNTPVAWSYEQAHTKISDGYETQYGDWRHHVSVDKPDVPDEAIRNLRALVYTQSDTICTSVNTLEDTVSLDLDANQHHTDARFEKVRQQPMSWHHPLCEGECFSCLIEREIEKAYGKVGLRYLLKHINAPVYTKDLTDDEIDDIFAEYGAIPNTKAVRAVIAAFKEKNK